MEQKQNNLPKEKDPKLQEYREFVLGLESTKDEEVKTRLDHAISGLVTEAGELTGLMKKIKFAKATIPRINFLDEAGDLFWYFIVMLNVFGVTLEDIARLNTTKLKTRYPTGYTNREALEKDKDLEKERMEEESI